MDARFIFPWREPNGERFHIAGAPAFALRWVEPGYGVSRETCSNAVSGTRTVEFHHCWRGRDEPDELGVLSQFVGVAVGRQSTTRVPPGLSVGTAP